MPTGKQIDELGLLDAANISADDLIEVTDVSAGESVKFKIGALLGGSIEFYDNDKTYEQGDIVVHDPTLAGSGSFESNADYSIFVCNAQTGTTTNWSNVSSNFDHIKTVFSDDSLTGGNNPSSDLSVAIEGVNYSTPSDTHPKVGTDNVKAALDALFALEQFRIIDDMTSIEFASTGLIVWDINTGKYQRFTGGDATQTSNWKEFSTYLLNNSSVTDLSDVQDEGSQKIIEPFERQALYPNVIDVTGTNQGNYLKRPSNITTHVDSYSADDIDNDSKDEWIFDFSNATSGDLFIFTNSLSLNSDEVIIELPIGDNGGKYFDGWHCFFFAVGGLPNIKVRKPPSASLGSLYSDDALTMSPKNRISVQNISDDGNYRWEVNGSVVNPTNPSYSSVS